MKTKEYTCGLWKYKLPAHACVFCAHCTDVFWDFSHGLYAIFCDVDGGEFNKSKNGNITGNCKDFREDEDT